MTRWFFPALLVLSGCAWFGDHESTDEDALAGSSTPPAEAGTPITGGVLVSPGAGGTERAVALAREICEQNHLNAQIQAAVTRNGRTMLQYSCQPIHETGRAPGAA